MIHESCWPTSFPRWAVRGPSSFGGSPVRILLYVDDVDATVARAIAAGAKLVRPVQDQFYGDRAGGLEDPFGHYWHIATHIEDVSPEEMESSGRCTYYSGRMSRTARFASRSADRAIR